jgi:hypothetical protein
MAHLAVNAHAADYFDVAIRGQNLGVHIEERVVPPDSALGNRSVPDIRHHELSGSTCSLWSTTNSSSPSSMMRLCSKSNDYADYPGWFPGGDAFDQLCSAMITVMHRACRSTEQMGRSARL